jgi:DNA-binding MarR family transcriptional regulator
VAASSRGNRNRQIERDPPLLWLVWETFQFTRRSFDDVLRPYGVSGTQLSVLNRIAEQPGLSGVELARMMVTTSQAVYLTLSALERKGLVERKASPGAGNIYRSVLTEEGRRLVEACRAEVAKEGNRLLNVLNADEQKTLRLLLSTYLKQIPDSQ